MVKKVIMVKTASKMIFPSFEIFYRSFTVTVKSVTILPFQDSNGKNGKIATVKTVKR